MKGEGTMRPVEPAKEAVMTKRANGWSLVVGLAAALLFSGAGGAWADPNQNDADLDQLTIRLTPNVDYGVDIDTGTTRFDVGTDLNIALSLNATHYFISPATVTILGNFSNQEVKLKAAGLDNWTVDNDEVIGHNEVQLYALFAVNKSSRPLESEFGGDSGRHQVKTTDTFAGETSGTEDNAGADNYYEIPVAMTGGADMDNLQVTNTRQLWLRLDTPAVSNYDTDERIQVTVTAAVGTTN
ncbi:MAG: hypothetical protein HY554_14625 [Elusimicrobia bacterium]|nr:hypothetical protein [Elusimicrobiota bacterium]